MKLPVEKMESKEQSVLTASEYKRQRKRFRKEKGVDKTKDVFLSMHHHQTMEALAAFRNKLKTAGSIEDAPSTKKTKPTTQNDLLATTRNDLVEEDEDDENAENGTIGWMNHQLKFVKHFEVGQGGGGDVQDSLRDSSFEPGADMYVTYDPIKDNPVGE